MERCPLCRAMLNGAETCRRCKAELQTVQRVERESQALVGAAMHRLSLGDTAASRRLLRLALGLHATPEVRALWRLVAALPDQSDADSSSERSARDRSALTTIDPPLLIGIDPLTCFLPTLSR